MTDSRPLNEILDDFERNVSASRRATLVESLGIATPVVQQGPTPAEIEREIQGRVSAAVLHRTHGLYELHEQAKQEFAAKARQAEENAARTAAMADERARQKEYEAELAMNRRDDALRAAASIRNLSTGSPQPATGTISARTMLNMPADQWELIQDRARNGETFTISR